MKVHLHDEQFDGCKHAACGRYEAKDVGDTMIAREEDFEQEPRKRRCRYCARLWWPKGGEPA